MQTYSLCIKIFGCAIIILLAYILTSCTISYSSYITRKAIRNCGCDAVCISDKYESDSGNMDSTTYYRLCSRR